jgi:hypothetical protein
LNKKLGGPTNRCECSEKKKKELVSAGIRKQRNYLKIKISNFYAKNMIVVLNFIAALTVARENSFLASNKIV